MGDVANDEAVKLAMQLIDVESLSGHEQPMASVLKEWLEKRGWTVELQAVEPQKGTVGGQTRHNLYACRAGGATASGGSRVLFNSHIDTVCADDHACRRSHVELWVCAKTCSEDLSFEPDSRQNYDRGTQRTQTPRRLPSVGWLELRYLPPIYVVLHCLRGLGGMRKLETRVLRVR